MESFPHGPGWFEVSWYVMSSLCSDFLIHLQNHKVSQILILFQLKEKHMMDFYLPNENTGSTVKFVFQMNNEYVFSIFPWNIGDILTLKNYLFLF